jgi:uncharacterized repeat protein (TIGR04076 family)
LYEQAQKQLLQRDQWKIRHVPREQNRRADELANMAMDAERDVPVLDKRNTGARDDPAPPSPATGEPSTAAPKIVAQCMTGPKTSVCSAPCRAGQQYTFEATMPADVCVDAMASMLNTVLAIRETVANSDRSVPPLTVRCFKRDCGAVFELTLEDS